MFFSIFLFFFFFSQNTFLFFKSFIPCNDIHLDRNITCHTLFFFRRRQNLFAIRNETMDSSERPHHTRQVSRSAIYEMVEISSHPNRSDENPDSASVWIESYNKNCVFIQSTQVMKSTSSEISLTYNLYFSIQYMYCLLFIDDLSIVL